MKLRHAIFSFLSLGLLLSACGPTGNHFKIEGRLKGMQPGEIYIYSLSDNNARFDTLKVKSGSFVYEGTAEEPTPYVLVFQNGLEQVIFVDGGQTLEYTASANDMKNYKVKGSDENKLLNEFRTETSAMTQVKLKAAARSFIEGHPASPVSVYMLDKYFVQDSEIAYSEILQLTQLLKKHQKNNVYLIDLETNIKILQSGDVGKTIPKLQLTTKTGKELNLGSISKSHLLVGFWATWLTDAWDMMSSLRNMSKDYSSSLQVLAISLDTQQYKWEEFVRTDSLVLDNVCDFKSWDSPTVQKFGVRELPFYVFCDNKGKILSKGSSVEDMKHDVEKLLKKDVANRESDETEGGVEKFN
jgi:hypothetical protein